MFLIFLCTSCWLPTQRPACLSFSTGTKQSSGPPARPHCFFFYLLQGQAELQDSQGHRETLSGKCNMSLEKLMYTLSSPPPNKHSSQAWQRTTASWGQPMLHGELQARLNYKASPENKMAMAQILKFPSSGGTKPILRVFNSSPAPTTHTP